MARPNANPFLWHRNEMVEVALVPPRPPPPISQHPDLRSSFALLAFPSLPVLSQRAALLLAGRTAALVQSNRAQALMLILLAVDLILVIIGVSTVLCCCDRAVSLCHGLAPCGAVPLPRAVPFHSALARL